MSSLNDDSIALLGCAVALLLCGGGMVLSYTLRRWITGADRATAGERLRAAAASHADSDRRKAA